MVLLTIAAAYILISSLQILVVTLIAIMIASAARSLVQRLERMHIPFGAAVLLVYGAILLSVLVLTLLVLPPIVNQLTNYLTNEDRLALQMRQVVSWFERSASNFTGNDVQIIAPDQINAAAESLVREVNQLLPSFANGLSATLGDAILVFVMGVYWLTSRDKIADFIENLFALKTRAQINQIFEESESAVGSYVRGVISVAFIVGALNFVLLLILRVPNAATYGFIIGVTTMLPVIGGFVGGGGATLLAALASPANGVLVFLVFVVVQQLETHWLTPRVMSRSMRIDPLLVIIGILAGFGLYGVIGGVIAVPIIGTLTIVLRHLVIDPQVEKVAHKVEGGAVILNTGEPVEKDETTPGGLIIGR